SSPHPSAKKLSADMRRGHSSKEPTMPTIPIKWQEKLESHPAALMWSFVMAFLMVATLAGRADWWNQKLSALIFASIIGTKIGQAISQWFLYLLDFLFVSIPILGLLLTQAEF